MTTPALTAVVAGPASERERAPANAKQTDGGQNFNAVLAGRPSTRPQRDSASHSGHVAHSDSRMQTDKEKSHEHGDTKDANGTSIMGTESPNLAQLALYIAAQANPATSAALPASAAKTQPDVVAMDATHTPLHERTTAERIAAAGTHGQPDAAAQNGTKAEPLLANPISAFVRPGAGEKTAVTLAAPTDTPKQWQVTHAWQVPVATPGTASSADAQTRVHPAVWATNNSTGPSTLPEGLAIARAGNHSLLDQSASRTDATLFSVVSAPVTGAASTTTAPVVAPSVAAPLHSPQWAGEFGRQFVSLTQSGHAGGTHSAQIRLDPPNLGPLHITININDSIAHAVFTSPHAAVRQAVENALPQLQQQLAQSGISLGQTSVNDQGSRGDGSDDFSSGRRQSPGVAQIGSTSTEISLAMATSTARRGIPNAIVDTFA